MLTYVCSLLRSLAPAYLLLGALVTTLGPAYAADRLIGLHSAQVMSQIDAVDRAGIRTVQET
jgi:hypothetical protein